MQTDDSAAGELRNLRRSMRDLVALSTLPAVWTGLNTTGIANSLADVLVKMLGLDLIFIRLEGEALDEPIEVARSAGRHADAQDDASSIRAAITPALNAEGHDTPSIAAPFGGGMLRTALIRFGQVAGYGRLVACSARPDFPTEADRLLLGVGANQTAIVLRRKRAELGVETERERLRVTLASIGDAVITTDAENRVTFLNAVAQELTGWTLADAMGQPLEAVFPIVDEFTRQPVANPAVRALGEGVIVGLANHTLLIAKDGTERPIDDSAAPIRDSGGKTVGVVLVFRDVTERRDAERALSERARLISLRAETSALLASREPFQAVLQKCAELLVGRLDMAFARVWTLDDAGQVLELRASAGLYTHLDGPHSRIPVGQFKIGRIAESGQPHLTNTVAADPNVSDHDWAEREQMVAFAGFPLSVEGRTIGVLAMFSRSPIAETVLKDLGPLSEAIAQFIERKRAEAELRENQERLNVALAALRDADRRKDEFLATLAHELRNPIAPVQNCLEIMKLTGGGPVAMEEVRATMERQVGQMVRLIDDLLDISRITRDKLELRKERVGLAAVIQSAVETSRPLIEAGGHELTIAMPVHPVCLAADAIRLAQVFSNLLNNAAKYTEHGGHIWLTAERQDGQIIVSVRDNGIGIPSEKLGGVFDMFMQVDQSLERRGGGLGIGLALVRRLVELHGGTIEARSEGAGRGSEFVIRLDIEAADLAAEPSAPKAIEPMQRGRQRILIADDNEDAATTLGTMLRLLGNEVTIAHDGLSAVEEAQRVRPDVCLMDIGMPSLNGYEAARRIREHSWGSKVLLIAVSGWGQDGDKRSAKEAGFDHHLLKPVTLQDLREALSTLGKKANR